MKAKMLVAYTGPVLAGENYDWRVRGVRNITIKIGCSCVYRQPLMLNFFHGPREKRSVGPLEDWNFKIEEQPAVYLFLFLIVLRKYD